jgi:hypothetical protein
LVSSGGPARPSALIRSIRSPRDSEPAGALPVDLELVLAVDASYSMGHGERLLQVKGYVDALRHPELVALIERGPLGRIALAYLEWAGPEIQRVLVPWTLIEDEASARRFADALEATPVDSHNSVTGLSDALLFAAGMFEENGFSGVRLVIDISGDGVNNVGPETAKVRDLVVRRGITVNGLPILLRGRMSREGRGIDVEAFYRSSVIGGEGAFAIAVYDEGAFAQSIRSKLMREIAQGSAVRPAARAGG